MKQGYDDSYNKYWIQILSNCDKMLIQMSFDIYYMNTIIMNVEYDQIMKTIRYFVNQCKMIIMFSTSECNK